VSFFFGQGTAGRAPLPLQAAECGGNISGAAALHARRAYPAYLHQRKRHIERCVFFFGQGLSL